MSEIDQGLRAATDKLKKILAKRKRGTALTEAESNFLQAAQGKPAPVAAPAGASSVEDTLDAAVSTLQAQFGDTVNKRFLQQLKKKHGAKAGFRGSRVYLDQLIPFLQSELKAAPTAVPGENPARLDKHTLECQKLLEQIEDLRELRAQRRGKYVERAAVVSSNRAVGAKIKDGLKKLINEMPAAVAGKTIPEAREYAGKLYDSLMIAIRDWQNEWPE